MEPPTDYYSVPERLVSYFRMEENFAQEYGFYFPFLFIIPFLSLVLSVLFRAYSLKKIFSLVLYFFGTCALYVTIYLGLFPGPTNWILPATTVAYATYYAIATTYGKVWMRLLKTIAAAALTLLVLVLVPFERIIQYAYYHALHADKILYATPDPDVAPSKLILEDYSEDKDGYHLAAIGGGRLFYTSDGQKRKLHLFDSSMQQSDTVTINGRIIGIEVISSDSLVVTTAIKGNRDSSEYALVNFLNLADLQLLAAQQLPTEYYTINDALWNQSLWV